MNSFLMKFVFRINGGINFYFVSWGNRVVREQYIVVTSDVMLDDHSPKCLTAFPGMFSDIPRNV